MRLIQVVLLLLLTFSFNSLQAKITAGKDYTLLSQTIAPLKTGQIELVEAFAYNCGHCQSLNPVLSTYVKTLPADVTFRPIHVYWDPQFMNLIRLSIAVETTRSANVNQDIFKAIINDRINLSDEKTTLNWLNTQTAFDGKKIAAAYNREDNKTAAAKMAKLTTTYKFEATPTLIVGGRYKVNNQAIRSAADLSRILSELIGLARLEQKPIKLLPNPGVKFIPAGKH